MVHMWGPHSHLGRTSTSLPRLGPVWGTDLDQSGPVEAHSVACSKNSCPQGCTFSYLSKKVGMVLSKYDQHEMAIL
jgi:hypothetical protein